MLNPGTAPSGSAGRKQSHGIGGLSAQGRTLRSAVMRYRLLFVALPLVMLAVIACAGCGTAAAQRVSTAHTQKPRRKTAQQRLAAAVAPLVDADDGHVAVAVADLT